MKITIGDKEISLKNSFRSMIMYENIMDSTFNPKGVTEVLVFFYCVILSSAKGIELTYDEFLDWLDDNPSEINNFSSWLTQVNKVQEHIKKN